MITVLIDIDGTICDQRKGDYELATPRKDAIDTINELYKSGFRIVFYTSRYMGRARDNTIEAYKNGYDITHRQLESWGVSFHDLWMGKPRSDLIIDDRSVFFKDDWKAIMGEVLERSKHLQSGEEYIS